MSMMSQMAMEVKDVEYTEIPSRERNLQDVTAEIITIRQQTQTLILYSSIEIGRRLCEAKEMIGHGNWGEYLKTVDFSPSTAHNLMRIYREYGDEQITFAGVSKSQLFGNLSYSKVVTLFALPEDERIEFVQENDVAEMSVSELKERLRQQEEEREKLRQQAEQAREEAAAAAQQQTQLTQELEKLRQKEQEAKSQADKLLEENKTLKEQVGKVPQEEIERIRVEAQEAAIQKAAADIEAANARAAEMEAAIEKAKEQAEAAAKAEVEAAKERVAQLERKLAVAGNDDTARMKVLFEDFQETFNKMTGIIAKIQSTDSELATKLRGALNTILANMKNTMEG